MLQKLLQKLGLSDKEAHIYLTSLRCGAQPVSLVAQKSGLQRTTVYSLIDSLVKKGIASKAERRGITTFSVLAPESLLHYLDRETNEYVRSMERKKQELAAMLPALQSLENPHTTKPKVRFFEGEKGIREAYEETLTSSEEIRAYANIEEMHKTLPNFFPEYYLHRKEAGIHIRAIFPNNSTSVERTKYNETEFRTTRLIDYQKYEFSPELNVYDNKVLIASWREKMAVVIESQEIADLHKKMFDLLWKQLSEEQTADDEPKKGNDRQKGGHREKK